MPDPVPAWPRGVATDSDSRSGLGIQIQTQIRIQKFQTGRITLKIGSVVAFVAQRYNGPVAFARGDAKFSNDFDETPISRVGEFSIGALLRLKKVHAVTDRQTHRSTHRVRS